LLQKRQDKTNAGNVYEIFSNFKPYEEDSGYGEVHDILWTGSDHLSKLYKLQQMARNITN
jgi:hypothetical protein